MCSNTETEIVLFTDKDILFISEFASSKSKPYKFPMKNC